MNKYGRVSWIYTTREEENALTRQYESFRWTQSFVHAVQPNCHQKWYIPHTCISRRLECQRRPGHIPTLRFLEFAIRQGTVLKWIEQGTVLKWIDQLWWSWSNLKVPGVSETASYIFSASVWSSWNFVWSLCTRSYKMHFHDKLHISYQFWWRWSDFKLQHCHWADTEPAISICNLSLHSLFPLLLHSSQQVGPAPCSVNAVWRGWKCMTHTILCGW